MTTLLPRLHLFAGWLTVVVFLMTGLHMKSIFPDAYTLQESVRYMYRANHVYILLAGLANVLLGSYLVMAAGGWRKVAGLTGSLLLLLAPVLLVIAFWHEPGSGAAERPLTMLGVFAMLLGTIAQALAAKAQDAPNSQASIDRMP
ncbi:MAG: hypothetical protein ACOY3X_06165 [Pseudomonadota bacterium]